MRNLKRCISLILVMLLMSLTVSVFAENSLEDVKIEYDRETGDVKISGKAPFAGNLEEPARLLILKPGTNYEDFMSGKVTFTTVGVHVDETAVSEDKSFAFDVVTFPETLPVGDYIVRIAVEDVTYDATLSFATKANVIAMLNNVTDADEIKANIEKYNDVYGLAIGDESDYAALSADGRNFVFESLCNKTYKDETEIKDAFDEAIQLYRIKEGPWGVVKAVIENHSELLGLDLSDYNELSNNGKTEVCKALVGNLYASGNALDEAIEDAVYAYEASENKQSGSGSSGGKGGSSNVSMQVVAGKNDDNEQEAEPESDEIFNDLNNYEWAEESIYKLYEKGIINGKADGVFAPSDNVKRAEAVKMIILALSDVDSAAECNFSDVSADSWMYPYVATASVLGFVNGYSEEYFGAEDDVKREDLAVIIVRAAEALGYEFEADDNAFADDDEISDYAKSAVYKLKKAGIINGKDNNSFAPKATATRAEAAKIIAAIIG